MRVAFFGLPLAALLLLGDGHEIVRASICRTGALGTRRLVRRLGGARVRIKPDLAEDETVQWLAEARPEMLVSWFWTTRIPPRVLALAPGRSVGVHPSLLPRHRGPDPYFWAIDSGDRETGVTAHRLAEEYDTGAIVAQRPLAIDPSWNSWKLAKALDRPSLALLREVVLAHARGAAPAETPQDERLATSAPEPDEALLALRWSNSADAIARRVRAASPWPGAFTEIGEELVTIEAARATRDYPRALAPGEAAVRGDGVAVVRAGDDAVELLAGRVDEDEGERRLDAAGLAALVRAAAARG